MISFAGSVTDRSRGVNGEMKEQRQAGDSQQIKPAAWRRSIVLKAAVKRDLETGLSRQD